VKKAENVKKSGQRGQNKTKRATRKAKRRTHSTLPQSSAISLVDGRRCDVYRRCIHVALVGSSVSSLSVWTSAWKSVLLTTLALAHGQAAVHWSRVEAVP